MNDTECRVPGPAGWLECMLSNVDESASTVAVICHPHPLHGGSMHNKVVHTIMRTCREIGVASVRFNFRGVGKSEGTYDGGVGELEDLLAIIEWSAKQYPHAKLWLAGFSFGAFVAAKSLTKSATPIERLLLVAPPVESFDFSDIDFGTVPTTVIIGSRDQIVPPNAVKSWVNRQQNVSLLWLDEADHFFHGRLTLLKDTIINHIKQTVYVF